MYSTQADPPPFAELHCRSNFTFLTGASQPEELVSRAAAKFYTALALTDECSVSGVLRAHLEARECGLHFIVGSEILYQFAGGKPFARLVLLAQDRNGYGNLCELITLARRRAEKGRYTALIADLEGKTSKGQHLAGAPGCLALLLPEHGATIEETFAQAMWLRTWFPGRAWIAAERPLGMDDDQCLWNLEQAAERAGLPIVATRSPLMHTRARKRLQDVLTAIRRRFWAVVASKNSSCAPLSPRSQSRSSFMMRLRCANSISTFFLSLRDWLYSGVFAMDRAVSRAWEMLIDGS